MLKGETILSGAAGTCSCGTPFTFEVMRSNAWYIGTRCNNPKCGDCGMPNSRESGYYASKEEAEKALVKGPDFFMRV
jgi:hypothetical protein